MKKYCRAAGIDLDRLGGRGIGLDSLAARRRSTTRSAMERPHARRPAREFAGHADIRTTAVHFVRREEDAEVVALWH